MTVYFAVATLAFRRMVAYRIALWSSVVNNLFWGSLICEVYRALYQGHGAVAGLTLDDAISYTWTTQAMISLGAGWVSGEIASTVRSGAVERDLTRPWSFYGYWLSRTLGEHTFNLLIRSTITYMFGVLVYGARLPAFVDLLSFVLVLVPGLLVGFAFVFLINATAFWLLDATGPMLLANVVLGFFSGFLLPLAYFPPWLQLVANALPFQAITNAPVLAWLGQSSGSQLGRVLVGQWFWAITMTLAALFVARRAYRHVVIQGG